MSGAIFQEAVRVLNRCALPEVAASDVLRVLEAAKRAPLVLFNELGHAAGLPREQLLQRGAGLLFINAAGNLADDLADGDCTYLEAPLKTGPSAQFLLQNLAFHTLAAGGVPLDVLADASRELALGAGAQHVEVRTSAWTLPVYQLVAEGISGRQFAAYLRLLWAGTALADAARDVGMAVGLLGHIATDAQTADRRFTSLSEEDRAEVRAWASGLADRLSSTGLPGVTGVVRWARGALSNELPAATPEETRHGGGLITAAQEGSHERLE